MRCSTASNDKYQVSHLKHGMMLTDATGDAEGVVRDGVEFGYVEV